MLGLVMAANVYAGTQQTNVCIYNPTQLGSGLVAGDRQILIEDNAGFAQNKMWDGTTSRPNYSSGKWLTPGSHLCQRVEINKSSGTHDMYIFYIGVYNPNKGNTTWNMVALNKASSYSWGSATSWSLLAYSPVSSINRPSIKGYAGEYDSFINANVPTNFIPAQIAGCKEIGEGDKVNCSRFDIRF